MIVEELRIRNWRSYRLAHRFRFTPGINLLVGPNEAGKSTLFEAMGRALFDRHTSKSREIVAIRPLGSTLGPVVELVALRGSERIRIVKRFLVEPCAELYRERNGVFELDHEGDRADFSIRRLLHGGESHGASKTEHRGLAQALWYLQRDPALPHLRWSGALREGLEGIAETALQSPVEQRILASIEKEYAGFFTPKGRVSARSELGRLESEVVELEAEAEQVGRRLERLRTLAGELEELEKSRCSCERELRLLRHELAVLEPRRVEAEARESARDEWQRELDAALGRREALVGHLRLVRRRRTGIEKLEARLGSREPRSKRVRQTLAAEKRDVELHAGRLAKEVEPAIAEIEPELDALQTSEQVERLRREDRRLQQDLEELRGADDEVGAVEAQLATLESPSRQEWEEWESRARSLRDLKVRRAGCGIEVVVRVHVEDLEIEVDPPTEPVRDRVYEVNRPTTFDLGGVAEVSVAAGDRQLETEISALEAETAAALERFGVGTDEELFEAYRERRDLEENLRLRRSVLDKLSQRSQRLESRRSAVGVDLEGLRARFPQPLLPGVEDWTSERRRLRIEVLKEQLGRWRDRAREEREAEQDARTRYMASVDVLQKLDAEIAELSARRAVLSTERDAALREFGKEESLASELEAVRRSVGSLRDRLRRLDQKPVQAPLLEAEAIETKLSALGEESAGLARQSADRRSRQEELSNMGLYGHLGDLEARLETKRRRLLALRVRAEGTRVLRQMVAARMSSRRSGESAEIAARLDQWWSRLSGGAYRSVTLDAELRPTAAVSSRYAEALSWEGLSYGSREQLVVLLRLSIGVALSEEERQLVVLDDRLVDADPTRLGRLCEILGEAAEHCQILLATCNEEPYSSLQANRIEVPGDAEAAESS